MVFAAQVFANACSLVMNWLLVRAYGKAGHSQVTLLISVMTTVTLIADLGLASKSGVRQLARLRSSGDPVLYLSNPDGITNDWILAGKYEVMVEGEMIPAKVHIRAPYDPKGERTKM